MNKIPHSGKWINIGAVFHTIMCEQGHFHVDKVKFGQVNNAGIRGGDHLVRQHRDSGRNIPC